MKNSDVEAQARTNWTTLCDRLKQRIAEYNEKKDDVRLVLEKGQVKGRVSVWAVGGEERVVTRLGFEMEMDTGGGQAWFEEQRIRHSRLPIVTTVESGKLVVRYEEEPVTIEELVDRALARWQTTQYSQGVRWSFTGD